MKTISITAFFTNDAIPQTGLTPLITITNFSNIDVVTNDPMTELSRGIYFYDFLYDPNIKYFATIDGGVTLLDSERYKYLVFPQTTVLAGKIS